MATKSNKDSNNGAGNSTTKSKITALTFANLKGFNAVDRDAVAILYKNKLNPEAVWEKLLRKDFVFNNNENK